MPNPINLHTEKLLKTWESHWQELGVSKAAIYAIDEDIKALREAILYELKQLE